MKQLIIFGGMLLLPFTAWTQTKWIAFLSHSGRSGNFSLDSKDGFGLSPDMYNILSITRNRSDNSIHVEMKNGMDAIPYHLDTTITGTESLTAIIDSARANNTYMKIQTRDIIVVRENPPGNVEDMLYTGDDSRMLHKTALDSLVKASNVPVIYMRYRQPSQVLSSPVRGKKSVFGKHRKSGGVSALPFGKPSGGMMLLLVVVLFTSLLIFISIITIRKSKTLLTNG